MFSLAISPADPAAMMLSCDMSEAYTSHDAGRTWQMIHHAMLKSCTHCAAVFDPKVGTRAIAPTGGSNELRVTTDGGRTWTPYGRGHPWQDAARLLYIDPDAPARVFVGTDAGAWMTPDDGQTWQRCEGVAGRVLGVATDRRSKGVGRTYFIGTTRGVFRSSDGGRTYAEAAAGLPEKQLDAFAGGSSAGALRLYAAVPCKLVDGKLAGGVYASADGGTSWQRCMNPDLNVQTRRTSEYAHGDLPQYPFLVTTDARPERAYVFCTGTSYHPPNHCTIYRTDDGGGRWTATYFSDPRFKEYNCDDDWFSKGIRQRWQDVPYAMAGCNTDPNVVALCASSYVFRTEDGGGRWRCGHSGPAAPAPDGELAWANNGLTVTTTWNYYVDPHEANRHYICYTDIGFARSLDAGRTWIWQDHHIPWLNTTYELAFDPDVAGRLWGAFSETHDIPNANVISGRHRVTMKGGVASSDDFGRTWKKVDLPAAPALSVVLDPASPRASRTLYASLFEKGVYRSDDGGKTWQEKNRGLGAPANLRCLKLVRHADGTLFVLITAKRAGDGKYLLDGVGLYRSADRGENWTIINASQPLYWPKDFTVHPADSRTVLLSAANARGHEEGGLYRTTDGGATWKLLVRKGSEHFGAFYHPDRPGWIYMTLTEGAPGAGLWLSRDDGATWEPFGGLPFSNIQRVHFNPADKQHLIVTTFGGSVFKGPVEPGK
jgi:photosystem II stability/assembly factor-like uncharacterized protein